MKKIIISDKNELMKIGLGQMVSEQYPDTEILMVNEIESLIGKIEVDNFDLLITDIEFPFSNYISSLKKIRTLPSNLSVLVMTSFNPEIYARRILKEGVSGLIIKSYPVDDYIEAIDKTMAGKKYISEFVVQKLLNQLDAESELHNSLTNKELEVFILFVFGKSIEEISLYFSMSISTTRFYRSKIFQKLNISSSAEMLNYAISNQIFSSLESYTMNLTA